MGLGLTMPRPASWTEPPAIVTEHWSSPPLYPMPMSAEARPVEDGGMAMSARALTVPPIMRTAPHFPL